MVLSKQSLKFFIALSFAQTGILMCVILLSGLYWHKQSQEFKVLSEQIRQFSCTKVKMDQIHSDTKIEKMKDYFENQGINVSED